MNFDESLKQRLYDWRDTEAHTRGLELWRILPNRSLDEIAEKEPATLRELAVISGVGPTKLADYGKKIIEIVENKDATPGVLVKKTEVVKPVILERPAVGIRSTPRAPDASISVGLYLEQVNRVLRTVPARVRGEVTQFKFQTNAYFTIKDKDGDGVLDVMMWAGDYALAGIDLEPGMEVIVEGFAEIYKAWGRFSFKAKTLEYAGEGALKKQYEALKKKLDVEGLFSESKKRKLAPFPEKIGVITSRTGAVIEDFLNNLGRHGFSVKLIDTRVEGAAAAESVLASIHAMHSFDIDTLVVIRGGGSLESLQAFNNEQVVRAVRAFSENKCPVICAIGHHQDKPLSQMAADFAPSTPTAAAELINDSWDRALDAVRLQSQVIANGYERALQKENRRISDAQSFLERRFMNLREVVDVAAQEVRDCAPIIKMAIERRLNEIAHIKSNVRLTLEHALSRTSEALSRAQGFLDAHDPMRQLRLGYSVARSDGNIVRSIKQVIVGDKLELQVGDGVIETEIKNTYGS